MTRRLFFAAVLAACGLLEGCRSEFHLICFNNTNDQVIFRRRADDLRPVVILACTGADVSGVSTDDVSIERNGHAYHYRYPPGYTYPSAAVPAGYERRVQRVGKAFCLQLAPDNRLYLLRKGEAFTTFRPSDQPAGFPLAPH